MSPNKNLQLEATVQTAVHWYSSEAEGKVTRFPADGEIVRPWATVTLTVGKTSTLIFIKNHEQRDALVRALSNISNHLAGLSLEPSEESLV